MLYQQEETTTISIDNPEHNKYNLKSKFKKQLKDVLKTSYNILKLEIPITASYVFEYSGTFVTNIMIGQINDKKQLAATALIATTRSFFESSKVLQNALSSYIKPANTQLEKYHIGGIAQQGLVMGLIVGTSTMVIAWQIKPILLFCKQQEEISQIVDSFYKIYLWSWPASFFNYGAKQFAQAAGAPYSTVALSIFQSALKISLGYVFIFGVEIGNLTIPSMGVVGMGLADTISACLSCIGYLTYLNFSKKMNQYELLKPRLLSTLEYLKKLFLTGLPIVIYYGTQELRFFILSLIVGSLNAPEDMLSAYSIQNQYHYIFSFPSYALTFSLTILITHIRKKNNLKKADIYEIKRIGNIGILMALLYSTTLLCISTLSYKLQTRAFIDIYNPDNRRIVHYTKILLPLSMSNIIFFSTYLATYGYLFGLIKMSVPTLNAIFSSWAITIPIAILFKKSTTLDVIGICAAQILGSFVAAGFNLIYWHNQSSTLSKTSIKKCEENFGFLKQCYKKLTFFKKTLLKKITKEATNHLSNESQILPNNIESIQEYKIKNTRRCGIM